MYNSKIKKRATRCSGIHLTLKCAKPQSKKTCRNATLKTVFKTPSEFTVYYKYIAHYAAAYLGVLYYYTCYNSVTP